MSFSGLFLNGQCLTRNGLDTGDAYSSICLTRDLYNVKKMLFSAELTVRFIRPRNLFALLTASTMCEVLERLRKFVMLRSFTEGTELFSMRDKCIIRDRFVLSVCYPHNFTFTHIEIWSPGIRPTLEAEQVRLKSVHLFSNVGNFSRNFVVIWIQFNLDEISDERSLTYKINKTGPRIVSWGPPDKIDRMLFIPMSLETLEFLRAQSLGVHCTN